MVALSSDYVLIILNSALEPCLRRRQLCARSALLRRIINLVYPVIAPVRSYEVIAPNVVPQCMTLRSMKDIERTLVLVAFVSALDAKAHHRRSNANSRERH